MGKRGAAEGLRMDWVSMFMDGNPEPPETELSPPSLADLAPRSAPSADSFSASSPEASVFSSPARPTRKRGGAGRMDIDWCAMFRTGIPEPPETKPSPPPAAAVFQRSARVEVRRAAGGGSKARKGPKKSEDAMVRVMEKYIEMRKKQAEDEAALSAKERAESRNVQDFSISRCIGVLHKMEGITRDERPRAYNVFKNAENRKIFLASATEYEETTVLWLRSEMADLPRRT